VKVMRSMMEGPSSGSNSSFGLVSEESSERMEDYTYQGYNVVKKVRLTDSHAKPWRVVSIYDMNVEMVCAFTSESKGFVDDKRTYSTRVGNE